MNAPRQRKLKDLGNGNNPAAETAFAIDRAWQLRLQSIEEAIRQMSIAMQMAEQYELTDLLCDSEYKMGVLHWQQVSYAEASEFHMRSLDHADRLSDRARIARALNGMGTVSLKKGDFLDTIQLFLRSIDIYESIDDPRGLAIVYNNIGVAYKNVGVYKKAVEYHFKALKIKEEYGEHHRLAASWTNLGLIHEIDGSFREAIECHERALEYCSEYSNPDLYSTLLHNLASTYIRLAEYHKAIKLLDSAERIRKTIGNIEGLATITRDRGKIYLALRDYEKAKEILTADAEATDSVASVLTGNYAAIILGRVYFESKDYEKAYEVLSKAYEAIQDYELIYDKKECTRYLSEVEYERGNYESAYRYRIAHEEYRDVLNEQKNKVALKQQMDKYAIEKRELELRQLNQRHNMLRNVNAELEVFASNIAHRVNRPLKQLEVIAGFVKGLDTQAAADLRSKELEGAVDELQVLLDSLFKYSSVGSTGIVVEKVDLNEIIDIVKQNLSEHEFSFECSTALPTVLSTKTDMIQLFQNIFSNAIKFRRPDVPLKISMTAVSAPDYYLVEVVDNGSGVEENKVKDLFRVFQSTADKSRSAGMGLAICKKIMDAVGGDIQISSTPGASTAVSLRIPRFDIQRSAIELKAHYGLQA